MSLEDCLAELEAENARLKADDAVLREQVAMSVEPVQALRACLAKDCHNSSKPPYSDSLAGKTRNQSTPSGRLTERPSGDQSSHPGSGAHARG